MFGSAGPTHSGGAAAQPNEHVPDQALPHVPAVVPPSMTLPDAAGHMSETTVEHLRDLFVFNTSFVGDAAHQTPRIQGWLLGG